MHSYTPWFYHLPYANWFDSRYIKNIWWSQPTCKLTFVSVNLSVNSRSFASFSVHDFISVDNSDNSSRSISISLNWSSLLFSSEETFSLELKYWKSITVLWITLWLKIILWHMNITLLYNYLSSSATCFKSEFISSFWEFNVSFVFKSVSSCAFRELSSLLILSLRALFSSVKVLYFSRTVTNSVAAAASMISLALCSCLDSCKDYYFRQKIDFVANFKWIKAYKKTLKSNIFLYLLFSIFIILVISQFIHEICTLFSCLINLGSCVG